MLTEVINIEDRENIMVVGDGLSSDDIFAFG